MKRVKKAVMMSTEMRTDISVLGDQVAVRGGKQGRMMMFSMLWI